MTNQGGAIRYEEPMVEVPRFQEWLKSFIFDKDGAMISFHIVKNNGDERILIGRTGVKKHLKGGANTTDHLNYLVTVFDMVKKGYRNINLSRVKALKHAGTTYIMI